MLIERESVGVSDESKKKKKKTLSFFTNLGLLHRRRDSKGERDRDVDLPVESAARLLGRQAPAKPFFF